MTLQEALIRFELTKKKKKEVLSRGGSLVFGDFIAFSFKCNPKTLLTTDKWDQPS